MAASNASGTAPAAPELDARTPIKSNVAPLNHALEGVNAEALGELLRRLRDIDRSYRDSAEKMGQLYMFADANRATALTRRLDQPMRNASQNEQAFAALLDELQMLTERPSRKR
ncbi:MAG: hypothetical protein ABI671_00980 [Burkholderiales bacterium]